MKFLGLVLSVAAFGMAAQTASAGVDPLTVEIDARDARRFADLLAKHPMPTAEQIQRGYLDGAGEGVRVFTPLRIKNAENLARAIAAKPQHYRHAVRECLPLLASLQPELRAIYLAYAGLQPQRPLPAIHVVFGATNSGGTASETEQVLGLEVMCEEGTTPDEFRLAMRGIFAHETVHSWQSDPSPEAQRDPLLAWALREGVPDYLASLVTGAVPRPERDAWARAREATLWQDFNRDRSALIGVADPLADEQARSRVKRWFVNYGDAPQGWPYEAGYWIGMRIAQAYVARATDPRRAITELIDLRDPAAILKASGYGE
jgi:hypothetical protein